MDKLIKRYVYDVTRRLPEKEREEVEKELTANIYDMLSEEPSDEEVKNVLEEFGEPAHLAEQYRQTPGYLISPAFYFDYIRILKWVVPLVGGILAIVVVIGELFKGNFTTLNGVINIFAGGISGGIEGALQAAFWVTIGFVIAERTSKRDEEKWSISKLPEIPDVKNKPIPISDSIAEMVFVVIFLAILIMVRLDVTFISIRGKDILTVPVFSEAFFDRIIVCALVGTLITVLQCSLKIVYRTWNITVCAAVILGDVIQIALLPYLFRLNDMFHLEFLEFLKTKKLGSHDILNSVNLANGDSSKIITIFCAIFIGAILIEIGVVISKMVKNYSSTDKNNMIQ